MLEISKLEIIKLEIKNFIYGSSRSSPNIFSQTPARGSFCFKASSADSLPKMQKAGQAASCLYFLRYVSGQRSDKN